MKKIYVISIIIIVILSTASTSIYLIKNNKKNINEKENKEENNTYEIVNKTRLKRIIIYNELKNITLQIVKHWARDEVEYPIFLDYTIWNKTGIQIYNDTFFYEKIEIPYNISVNMPKEPPYMVSYSCSETLTIYGNSMQIDDIKKEGGKVWFELTVDKPYSSNSIYYELNNTTVTWNFLGIDLLNSSFYGKFTIIDPIGREQIMINHTKDGWFVNYNKGARFPVRGVWKMTLETNETSGHVKLPLFFGYIDKKELEKRGFTFV